MMNLLLGEASTSMLAAATTAHLAVLLLRYHRNPPGLRYSLLLLPTAALTASPWLFPSLAGIAAGLVAHLIWFVACDRLVPRPVQAAPAAATPAPVRTSPPVAAAPARRAAAATGFVKAPVIAVIRETDDITTFRIARPEGFEFAAGQFLTVRVAIDGKPVSRCYSVSSAPEATGYLEISIKRQGSVSGMLHATVRPGTLLEVMRPAGPFVYPADDQRPITLLAGGVGITPLMSMLRHAVQADPTRPVTLLYSVHTQRDIAFRDELASLARRHPQAKVVVTTTRGPHSTEVLSGRIDRRLVTSQVADLEQNIFMICGPGPMIDAMKQLLGDLGIPQDQVRAEAFEAAVASAAAADAGRQPAAAAAGAAAASGFRLQLVESGHTIVASGDQTLLETCEANGVVLPSACRAGVCGSCRSRLVEGEVRCESDLLDDRDRADGYILPCVSWPTSDCAMEA
jgi:ferredoxin-NADP reductase